MGHVLTILTCTLALANAASIACAAENGPRNRGEPLRAAKGAPAAARKLNAPARGVPAPQVTFKMTLDATEEPINLANIHNAPNGHISYQSSGKQLRLWVSGRPTDTTNLTASTNANSTDDVQSTFVIEPKSWDPDALRIAPAQIAYTHTKGNKIACDDKSGQGFDRDYAAVNSVVPGANGAQ